MQELTPEGQRIIQNIAQRHGISADAALTLLRALVAGQGTMAQFSHPDLGGMGQWSEGGMIMVGDMFMACCPLPCCPRATARTASVRAAGAYGFAMNRVPGGNSPGLGRI